MEISRNFNKDKRGQFYMISAIALAAILIGIVSISNYIGKDSNPQIFDLEQELKIESRSVIDYGMYNALSDADFHTTLLNFTGNYANQATGKMDVYFLFGTPTNITVRGYQKEDISVIFEGSANTTITTESGVFIKTFNPGKSSTVLYIDGRGYDFELTIGRNIYFVLHEELNSNEYVVKW
ncbi:MAG: hypothetical protein KKB29_00630 [Nanoarchaeota archaeon]|nr:hypothetical protein [Nanoarchaeota archaeon]